MVAKLKKRTILVEYQIDCEDKFCGNCEHSLCEGPLDQPWAYRSVCCLFDKMINYNKKAGCCRRHKKCVENEISKKQTWTKT